MASPNEEVLVIPRFHFENTIPKFQGIRTVNTDILDQFLLPSFARFMRRDSAESDPMFKQLIPYCICKVGNEILCYSRTKSGGESRLHNQLSIGVGGHINPVDVGSAIDTDMYYQALSRELLEELGVTYSNRPHVSHLINDDVNLVGQVHLGLVHIVELESKEIFPQEDALSDFQFLTIEELKNNEVFPLLETWSQFCVNVLAF